MLVSVGSSGPSRAYAARVGICVILRAIYGRHLKPAGVLCSGFRVLGCVCVHHGVVCWSTLCSDAKKYAEAKIRHQPEDGLVLGVRTPHLENAALRLGPFGLPPPPCARCTSPGRCRAARARLSDDDDGARARVQI